MEPMNPTFLPNTGMRLDSPWILPPHTLPPIVSISLPAGGTTWQEPMIPSFKPSVSLWMGSWYPPPLQEPSLPLLEMMRGGSRSVPRIQPLRLPTSMMVSLMRSESTTNHSPNLTLDLSLTLELPPLATGVWMMVLMLCQRRIKVEEPTMQPLRSALQEPRPSQQNPGSMANRGNTEEESTLMELMTSSLLPIPSPIP